MPAIVTGQRLRRARAMAGGCVGPLHLAALGGWRFDEVSDGHDRCVRHALPGFVHWLSGAGDGAACRWAVVRCPPRDRGFCEAASGCAVLLLGLEPQLASPDTRPRAEVPVAAAGLIAIKKIVD